MTHTVISRGDAAAAGLRFYFTGSPCNRGHIALRKVCDYSCCLCKPINSRALYARDPVARRLYANEWRAANLEKERRRSREQKRDVYPTNRDIILARNRNWAHANGIKILARNRRARALERSLESTLTAGEWEMLLSRSPHCHWCGRKWTKSRRPTHDHVIPHAKGGGNTLENSVCSCLKCNTSKRDRLVNPVTGQGILL